MESYAPKVSARTGPRVWPVDRAGRAAAADAAADASADAAAPSTQWRWSGAQWSAEDWGAWLGTGDPGKRPSDGKLPSDDERPSDWGGGGGAWASPEGLWWEPQGAAEPGRWEDRTRWIANSDDWYAADNPERPSEDPWHESA